MLGLSDFGFHLALWHLPAVCSACIRQNLEFQERKGLGDVCCPSCRKPCDARDLQANLALRDAVERYRAARPLLVQLLHSSVEWEQRRQKELEATKGRRLSPLSVVQIYRQQGMLGGGVDFASLSCFVSLFVAPITGLNIPPPLVFLWSPLLHCTRASR
jgi:hypothetical protein